MQQYRNVRELTSIEGVVVDEQSLWDWNVSEQRCVLVDADQHVTAPYTKGDFIPVYKPHR